jgi:hypothetical protein
MSQEELKALVTMLVKKTIVDSAALTRLAIHSAGALVNAIEIIVWIVVIIIKCVV